MMEKSAIDPNIVKIFDDLNRSYAPGYRFEDEENFDDLVSRAKQTLQLLEKDPAEHIAVVTHGLFLRVLMAVVLFGDGLTGHELWRVFVSFKSANTGLTILEYLPSGEKRMSPEYPWRIFVWNDHAHLG